MYDLAGRDILSGHLKIVVLENQMIRHTSALGTLDCILYFFFP
jgi:hypothetical protein